MAVEAAPSNRRDELRHPCLVKNVGSPCESFSVVSGGAETDPADALKLPLEGFSVLRSQSGLAADCRQLDACRQRIMTPCGAAHLRDRRRLEEDSSRAEARR